MSKPSPNLAPTGWMRNLPAPALRAYMGLWLLAQGGEPPRGDLDDERAAFWVSQIAPRGLDAQYDPSDEKDWVDDLENEEALWEEWQGYAEGRNRPLTSCRDVVEFMLELELIERAEEGTGDVTWRVASHLPHVEDVLPLNAERREIESQIRWRESFRDAGREITSWLAQQSPPAATKSEIETSIQAIATDLGLDPEDVRHGLSILLAEDIQCDVDPETAASDDLLRLRIDWKLFEEWRTVYRLRSEGDEGG